MGIQDPVTKCYDRSVKCLNGGFNFEIDRSKLFIFLAWRPPERSRGTAGVGKQPSSGVGQTASAT